MKGVSIGAGTILVMDCLAKREGKWEKERERSFLRLIINAVANNNNENRTVNRGKVSYSQLCE